MDLDYSLQGKFTRARHWLRLDSLQGSELAYIVAYVEDVQDVQGVQGPKTSAFDFVHKLANA
jgi:hypothetical protein